MTRVCTTVLLLLFTAWAAGQPGNVSGTVKDADTKKAIAYCNIRLAGSSSGVVADSAGQFNISVPGDSSVARLIISHLNYATDTLLVNPVKNNYILWLKPLRSELDEVIVTGVSSATRTREIPVAVTVVSSKEIEHTIESNIMDVLSKNVPGLNMVKTGPNISKPFIRGLGYNRVLTLYDGIRQEGQQWGDEHGIEVGAYTIERAEVIKGPASILYGSDALAGVINLIPAWKASDDKQLRTKIFSEYQSNNGLTGNGIQLMYGSSRWSFALLGSYRVARNYTNRVDGRVYYTGFREIAGSFTTAYKSNTGYSRLSLTLYDDLQGIPDGSRDSLTRKFTKQVFEIDADDIKHRPIVPEAELNSYALSPLHQHIQHYRIYSNSHYRLGKGSFDASIAFQENIRREYNHPTVASQAGMYVRLNTVNYGLRYNMAEHLNTTITVGVNGMYQHNKNKEATDFPIPDYHLFDGGLFGLAKWKNGRWTISAGIRYDTRYLQGNDFYTRKDAATGFTRHFQPGDTAGAYLQFPSFKQQYSGISLSFGVTNRISDHVNIKINIARGYRAPNITEFASNGLDPGAHIVYRGNRSFVPEFSLQEDLGAEISFGNWSSSLSFFNNNIAHYIYLSQLTDADGNPVVVVPGNKTYAYQQSSAQLFGMECSVNIHPAGIPGFSFGNGLSLIYGFNRKKIFEHQGILGEYLPLIPPFKFTSSLSQDIKVRSIIIPLITVKANIEMNGRQNRYLALDDTETGTPGYTLLNAGMGFRVDYTAAKSVLLQIQINNLLNAAYQSNLSRLKYFEYFSSSPTGRYGIYNMGRNCCVKAIFDF